MRIHLDDDRASSEPQGFLGEDAGSREEHQDEIAGARRDPHNVPGHVARLLAWMLVLAMRNRRVGPDVRVLIVGGYEERPAEMIQLDDPNAGALRCGVKLGAQIVVRTS
jgi:hypothetical protein